MTLIVYRLGNHDLQPTLLCADLYRKPSYQPASQALQTIAPQHKNGTFAMVQTAHAPQVSLLAARKARFRAVGAR